MENPNLKATLGEPELEPWPGMAFTFVQRTVRITASDDFRDLNISQLDGVVLALDWVTGAAHHVWGSAVMVGPGIALTAGHVVKEMRERGFLGQAGGQIFAFGFHADRMEIWRSDSITSIGEGDLSVLTLIRSTGGREPNGGDPVRFGLASMAARMPRVDERLTLIGFRAAEVRFEGPAPMGMSLLGGVGAVTDVYPSKRDEHGLPNPAACVAARTVNGMSGGGAFDEEGNLVGVIATGVGDEHSFVSLSWPAIYTPVEPKWPPPLAGSGTSLAALARTGFCTIRNLDDVIPFTAEDGTSMVSISAD